MKVHFQRTWFAPGCIRFKKSASRYDLQEVPDELRPHLPSSARVVENPEAPPAPVKETLLDHDHERSAQDLVQAKIAEAENRRK